MYNMYGIIIVGICLKKDQSSTLQKQNQWGSNRDLAVYL